jgi:hypothetical protein
MVPFFVVRILGRGNEPFGCPVKGDKLVKKQLSFVGVLSLIKGNEDTKKLSFLLPEFEHFYKSLNECLRNFLPINDVAKIATGIG